jgi:signal transduction histidine kinase
LSAKQTTTGEVLLRLGTKLSLYLSLIILLVLSGYGYLDILSRRDVLIRKMKSEVRSMGRTLGLSLDNVSLPGGRVYVQDLIDAVSEYERTLGVIIYYTEGHHIVRSRSLEDSIEPYLRLTQKAIQEDRPQEEFGFYKKFPIFSYASALKDRRQRNFGGVCILQNISFMEGEIKGAKWSIFISIFVLIAGTMAVILFGTREWVTLPISRLMVGIDRLAKGNLDQRMDVKGGEELSRLAQAFNQMAVALKKAQERIIQESEAKLELERSLRQSSKLATVGQLTFGLAHEVGTPLNIIAGRAELIKRRHQDKDGQKDPDIILQQTERITKIIQQLLGFVRKKSLEQRPLKIKTVIESILDLLDHEICEQKVTVVKEWGNDIAPIMGNPDQLQQVFLNLILNAIQSMPQGGTLRLSLALKSICREGFEGDRRPYGEICVEDTGTGMNGEVLQNIFNPFFTTKEKGTGLGLMVTQGIIRDHEGWIEVESEVGKGSAFKVYLPVCKGS